MANVLVVDDEAGQRKIVASILKSVGHLVYEAPSVDDALHQIAENRPEVVLTDLKMPGKSGLILVEEVSKSQLPPEIVVITAFGTVETAVKAMRSGAYDYLNKPLEREELLMVVERAAEKYGLRVDGIQLRMELTRQLTSGLIAESRAHALRTRYSFKSRRKRLYSAGTGRIRHGQGTYRAAHPLSEQARPQTHAKHQLRGLPRNPSRIRTFRLRKRRLYRGSRRIGLIESASGSTLFLDEVADMSLSTQAKLLRVLQEKEIRRVGGTKSIPVDIRIISATNKNLEEAIKQGTFRDDLFYRLNIIPITIPPLRERNEDIKALINYFINRSGRPKTVEPQALRLLTSYNWLGNVRELEAVMERITVLSSNDVITVDDLPVELKRTSEVPCALPLWELPKVGVVFEELERSLILQALNKSNGVMADAAKLLGMTYRTFQYRAEKFGLKGD